MIGIFKIEDDDWVKIPFKGKIVDGRVESSRVYYDKNTHKAYNQYSVSIRGAKCIKKIFEDKLLKYNPNGGVQKKYDPSTRKIVIKRSECGPDFTSCHITGDMDFDDLLYVLQSNYLGWKIKVK